MALDPQPEPSEAAPQRPIASAARAGEIPEVVVRGPADPGTLDRKLALFPGLCGARLREGGTCMELPATGRSRCRVHGGATPVGPRSPHFHQRPVLALPRAGARGRARALRALPGEPLGGPLAEHLAVAMVQQDRAVRRRPLGRRGRPHRGHPGAGPERHAELRPLGDLALKGIGPTPAWELVHVRPCCGSWIRCVPRSDAGEQRQQRALWLADQSDPRERERRKRPNWGDNRPRRPDNRPARGSGHSNDILNGSLRPGCPRSAGWER